MKNQRKSNLTALHTLLGYMGKRRILLLLAILTATLSTALGMAPYLIVGLIAEKILGAGNNWASEQSYLFYGILALVSILGKGWLFSISGKLSHMAAFPVLYDIRLLLAEKLTKLPLGFFQANEAGKIKNMMNEQVDALEEGLAHFLPSITASTAVPFLTMLFMFVMDWRLALTVALYAVLLYFTFQLLVKRIMKLAMGMHKTRTALQAMILRYVYGMKVIKAFARGEESYDRFKADLESNAFEMEDIDLKVFGLKSIIIGVSRMSLVFLVPAGIWLYVKGSLELSVFIFFLLLALGFGKTFFHFIHSGTHIIGDVRMCMDTVTAFINQPVLKEPDIGKTPLHNGIEFDKVSFSYGEKKVIEDMSFTVKPGTITAVTGASGSGKSTIIRLLARFWDVNSGNIKIGDTDIQNISSADLANYVSCVFQEVFLFHDTILENIRIGKPEASDDEVMAAAKAARCHEFIIKLPQGYHTDIGEHGGRLSGGQRQRLSIARAILKNSPILLLDEATAFVDAENEAYIQEALTELMYSEGKTPKTLIVVAHRLHTIVHADQILVLHEGQVEAAGTHPELLKNNSRYQGMWAAYQRSEEGLKPWETSEGKITASSEIKPKAIDKHIPNAEKAIEDGIVESSGDREENSSYEEFTRNISYWKRLFSLAGEDKKGLYKACLYPVLTAVLFSISTVSLAMLVSFLLENKVAFAWISALVLFLSQIGQILTERFSQQEFCRYDSGVLRKLRIHVAKHLKKLPMGFFYQYDGASLQARLTMDVNSLSAGEAFSMVISGLFTPFLLFFVLFKLNWILALLSLVGVPIYLFMTAKINGVLAKTEENQHTAKANVNSKTLEFIQGIPVIRSFASPDMRLSRYEKAIREYGEADMNTLNRYLPYEAWYSVFCDIGFAVVLFASSVLIAGNRLEGQELLLFMIILLGALEPMPLLSYVMGRRKFMAAADRISEILTYPVLSEPVSEVNKLPQGFEINIKEIAFAYDKSTSKTIKDVSLVIPERTITALVGPSGGGKTTLLHLISRFWDIESGSICIGGTDIRDMTLDTLMNQISVVFQEVYLFKDTILNNIRFGNPEAGIKEVIAAAKAARCHDFITALPDEYNTVVGEGGTALSGGERQRISIARAILKNSPIILLDEATSSIDPENEWEIQEALKALSCNKTLVVVAHRLSTIQHADQIAVIEEGSVVQIGRHEQLLQIEGRYQKLWSEKTRVQNWFFSAKE